MSLDATRWAWEQKCRPTHKLVLLSLADRAGEGHECHPSIKRLQLDTGLYRETIMEAIVALESDGLIEVGRVNGRGNRYRLIGVVERHNQSAKADQYGKADQSAKADGTSREKPTTTSREKPIQNLPVESTKNLPSKQGKKFVPPTEDEVRAYCLERSNNVDASRWHAHYTANGWRVGKNPMKNWQAAVRTWETSNGSHQRPDTRSRAKRHHDKLREIAERSLARERGTS